MTDQGGGDVSDRELRLFVLRNFLADIEREGGFDLSRAYRTVGAVYHFLLAEGVQDFELHPIQRLWMALGDHDDGRANPILEVNKRPGNRTFRADRYFKCCAAAMLTLFVKSGIGKRDALRMMHDRLAAAGISITTTTLDGWHREISCNRAADEGLFESYYELVKVKLHTKDEFRALANKMLDGIPKLIRQEIGNK